MLNRLLKYPIFFFSLWLITGCNGGEDRNIPNVDDIQVELNVRHFAQDLAAQYGLPPAQAYAALSEAYPIFLDSIFVGRMLPMLRDTVAWSNFYKAELIHDLVDTCNLVYQDFEKYELELEEAFQFYKYYFPDRKVPTILSYVSEYNYGNFSWGEDILGIGLDFFLGADYRGYPLEVFPKYVLRTMSPEHLVTKTMKTLVNEIVPENVGQGRMLDHMIRNGKVLYILDHLLPNHQDSIKFEYTQDQVDWVKQNELGMWTFFVGEEMLYSTQFKDYRKYVEISPKSPGMPPEAPGRTANYIGWKIVSSYMKRFPQLTFEELIQKNSQDIFTQSKYKPNR